VSSGESLPGEKDHRDGSLALHENLLTEHHGIPLVARPGLLPGVPVAGGDDGALRQLFEKVDVGDDVADRAVRRIAHHG